MKGLSGPEQHPRASRRGDEHVAANILVVDDDESIRELLRLHLKRAGYRVSTAEDAVAAGHMVVEQPPDLIIADFKMPYMNGVDFVAALRADATIPDIPVIFLTAMENANELIGRTFGYPMLTKPLRADELLAAVAAVLSPPA